MTRAAPPLLAALLALSGCGLLHHRTGPTPTGAHFLIGQPYKAGGEWHYPRSFGAYDLTGLSTLIAPNHPRATTDGEAYDPDGLMAQSPVLPLPSLVRLTNLDTGRSLTIRVNDRGPDTSGRIIAVTPRVARLLGMPADGVAEVRVRLLANRSAALQGGLGAGPHLKAAPVSAVSATALAPPPGAQGISGRVGGVTRPVSAQSRASAASTRLSGTVHQAPPSPGRLYVEIGGFGAGSDAARLRARLADLPGTVVPQQAQGRTLYAVRLGPYRSVSVADSALHEVLRRGVPDPEITVR